jgi:CspA family cold shock protein
MSETTNINIGEVKWFDKTKGYGFIKVDGVTQDVFVHISAIVDTDQNLQPGDRVEFVIGEGKQGKQEEQVRKIGTS